MVVVQGHGNLPAGSDGDHIIYTEAISDYQVKEFEACCSFSPSAVTGPFLFVLWHSARRLATIGSSARFRGAWVILGGDGLNFHTSAF